MFDRIWTIQSESFRGRSANGGQWDDIALVITPGKVIEPTVVAWMKKSRFRFRFGIECCRSRSLGPVAARTGVTQI